MNIQSLIWFAAAPVLSPLMLGIINRTKAGFAGRKGPPLLQSWFDILKLLRKGSTYSRTTTLVFRLSPHINMATTMLALLLVPAGFAPSMLSFQGDILVLAYLMALARMSTVLAALDTGSAFEGMGASREVWFSALAEPALLLGLFAVSRLTAEFSLSPMSASVAVLAFSPKSAALGLVACALFVVLLAESSRVPVDDPNTHLELTMIHEVMILDHSGPDLAIVEWAASLKIWLFSALISVVCVPFRCASEWLNSALFLALMAAMAVFIGFVESTMARLRLIHVPRLLVVASTISVTAVFVA